MADLRMNQLATATDGAYIYAEASNGSQVKIAKEILAAILQSHLSFTVTIIKPTTQTLYSTGVRLPIKEGTLMGLVVSKINEELKMYPISSVVTNYMGSLNYQTPLPVGSMALVLFTAI